jgi:probable rRNA maturation factor
MRALNRRTFGRDHLTDVIAFSLPHVACIGGDVYVCASAAAQMKGKATIPLGEELIRLVVHGTLHVLGHDHPAGAGRTRSAMWRRQEHYVMRLRGRRS